MYTAVPFTSDTVTVDDIDRIAGAAGDGGEVLIH